TGTTASGPATSGRCCRTAGSTASSAAAGPSRSSPPTRDPTSASPRPTSPPARRCRPPGCGRCPAGQGATETPAPSWCRSTPTTVRPRSWAARWGSATTGRRCGPGSSPSAPTSTPATPTRPAPGPSSRRWPSSSGTASGATGWSRSQDHGRPEILVGLEEALELGQGGVGVGADEDAVEPDGPGPGQVDLEVVEEDGVAGSDAAEALQREVVDAGVGFADADLAGADHGVEQAVEVEAVAPVGVELLEVVADHGGP